MKRQLIALIVLIGTIAAMSMAYPTKCPFVDIETGLPCLGVPMPVSYTAAGAIYECSNGHRWVEAN